MSTLIRNPNPLDLALLVPFIFVSLYFTIVYPTSFIILYAFCRSQKDYLAHRVTVKGMRKSFRVFVRMQSFNKSFIYQIKRLLDTAGAKGKTWADKSLM